MILQLRTQIDTDLNKKTAWWNSKPDNETNISQAIENFNTFLDNILSNFAENSYAYQQISSPETAKQYLDPMLSSILHYPDDIKNWKKYLAS